MNSEHILMNFAVTLMIILQHAYLAHKKMMHGHRREGLFYYIKCFKSKPLITEVLDDEVYKGQYYL